MSSRALLGYPTLRAGFGQENAINQINVAVAFPNNTIPPGAFVDLTKALAYVNGATLPPNTNYWQINLAPGTYTYTTPLTIPSNVMLNGDGKYNTVLVAPLIYNGLATNTKTAMIKNMTQIGNITWNSLLTAPPTSGNPTLYCQNCNFPNTPGVVWTFTNAITTRVKTITSTAVTDTISSTVMATIQDTQCGPAELIFFEDCNVAVPTISDGVNAVPWVNLETPMAAITSSFDFLFVDCRVVPLHGMTFSGSATQTHTSTVVNPAIVQGAPLDKSLQTTINTYTGAYSSFRIVGGQLGVDELTNGGAGTGLIAVGNDSYIDISNETEAAWQASTVVPHLYVGTNAWASLHAFIYKANNALYASEDSDGIDRKLTLATVRNPSNGDVHFSSSLSNSFVDQVAKFHSLALWPNPEIKVLEYAQTSVGRNTATIMPWQGFTNTTVSLTYFNLFAQDTYVLSVIMQQ